jgi:hypothetical protein
MFEGEPVRDSDQIRPSEYRIFGVPAISHLSDVAEGLSAQRGAALSACAASPAGLKVEGGDAIARGKLRHTATHLDDFPGELVP